ncbi:MAG: hypothetical protein ACI9F1_000963 [Colwellia sp.]|jgi:hypothetical protein
MGDWDRDGKFSLEEKLISDRYMDNISETIMVNTSASALNGYT